MRSDRPDLEQRDADVAHNLERDFHRKRPDRPRARGPRSFAFQCRVVDLVGATAPAANRASLAGVLQPPVKIGGAR